ncbi:MAG: 30S ribosomal protein S3, partial [Treponema sp.]|nr:30S ribosomal protein S3 [Treponema sp.]
GKIGVKVWVYNGMKYGHEQNEDAGQLVRKPRHDRSQASGDEKPRARRNSRAADTSKE